MENSTNDTNILCLITFGTIRLPSFITLTMTWKLKTVANLQEAVSVSLVLFAAF